ncbi:uncharacterized protein FIBRA_06450 [Fibroporia radiculosa]|uniref:C3H1-type domain-containing protein n=1 Tax=Fibroporia radiculosa TaxID=599839 RepID=J4H430_9APHY|nr:uncharacterized protein FIBRA_06450 [Fibroporia radiculosa]CCM04279.1 predicted protein [Fibroporia radiculosa]
MSRRTPQVCNAFASVGRCRFGDRCKFAHQLGQPAGSTSSPVRAQAPTPSQRPKPGPAPGVPPRVCNLFWTSGSCARGFDCSFKHERKPVAPESQEAPVVGNEQEEIQDFFSAEGLAVSNGSVREERNTLTPSEAHNHIKAFLGDNYAFDGASRVQGFVRILASINDRNKSWNSDNAQAFLDMIVNGNGVIRIGDVLRFEPVHSSIGTNKGILSFQRGYFPVFEYFASNLVLKSTLHKNINHLYTVLENNYDTIHAVIENCIGSMIDAKSWKDPTPGLIPSLQNSLDGVVVFKTLSTVLHQFLNRFKDAVRNHPDTIRLVGKLVVWFESWASDVTAVPPCFNDPITMSPENVRSLTIRQLRDEIVRLESIVERESETLEGRRRLVSKPALTIAERRQALLSQLAQTYDPPGILRDEGPRHDNDHVDISAIRLAPTHDELLCAVPPYLPVFLPDAPHHLPVDSMERHLDIQFRLLREELIATIRSSVAAIHGDLAIMWQKSKMAREPTKLEELLNSKGGAYRTSGFDSVFFQIYTGARFSPVRAERRDLTVGLVLDAPNHRTARDSDAKKRYEYWSNSKRLQGGSLVALVLVSHKTLRAYLGVISSFSEDIAESSKANAEEIQVRMSFFDAEIEFMALRRERISVDDSTFAFLIDNSVMYEAVRHFLQKLQTTEPTEIPFSRYISHSGLLENIELRPPQYATAPRFEFNLNCLNAGRELGRAGRIQPLNINRAGAVDIARRELLELSTLDPSQINAVLDTFTREVSLIQGPPGTGKSFTAKEILRVLFASGIRPIVLIAYTNHALDHMLTSVLDAKITEKLVRLGSRSSDERIGQYTLDKLEHVAGGTSMLDRPIKRQYAIMKKLEEDMAKVMTSIQLPDISWEQIENFLDIHYPEHAESILTPPYWVNALYERARIEEEENGEWTTTGKKQSNPNITRTLYGFWRDGEDIKYIQPQVRNLTKKKKRLQQTQLPEAIVDPAVAEFFASLGFGDERPPVPVSTRPIQALLQACAVWSMSLEERTRLSKEWEQIIRQLAYSSNLQHYEGLRTSYRDACKEYNDIRDETRRRLLSQSDLIGCTTTGAAKLTSLLSNISPQVLMVEEAGQVLEAHILTSLVPSGNPEYVFFVSAGLTSLVVKHLICIGDPQQLRPTLATFALSMDSERGKQLFKFDRSMMERLAESGLPMSQINVQRRMRPSISHFIREILYPKLEDNEAVLVYPPVVGMQKDVYFFNHTHKENGSDDSVSKYNDFEVEMIRDLVLYFLRQGIYNGAGDIAVLCAYLGQLQKVRAALRDLKIAVSVDERDQEQLARQGVDEDVGFEEVIVAKHIRLGTVDIFQGQEAKIVIVSLVRNSGTFETGTASIGFLKSSNRINVALSRAKHGLYILGNAANLRRNSTWSTILDEMEAREQIGHGLPITALKTITAILNARLPVVSVASILNAPTLALNPALRVWNHVYGLAHTIHVRSCADRSVRGFHATNHVHINCSVAILAPQTCVVCLADDKKADIVDFIMQRSLADIDLSSNDTSERLITLECGHIFTVETLDGHCGMATYYDIDMMGRFTSTKAPPINYQTPPTCPTCRGPIAALRYGRVTKRATLDILEQNVASSMSRALEDTSPAMERISSTIKDYQESAKAIPSCVDADLECATRSAEGKSNEPLDPALFGAGAMQTVHGFAREEAYQWYKIVKQLVVTYRSVVKVANTRGAHVKAYEAALTTLYHLELEEIAKDPTRMTDTPEPVAFDAVNIKIGQPPHKADTRFQIDAYLLSLELRFMLAQIGTSRIEGLRLTSEDEKVMQHRQLWVTFVDFILASCTADAQKALLMAQRSSASRQAARSMLYILRSQFELFRTQLIEERAELHRMANLTEVTRQALANKITEQKTQMLNFVEKAEREYIRSRPSSTLRALVAERKWFHETCRHKVHRWRDDCDELTKFVLNDKIYLPLSLQEREDIVKAFKFCESFLHFTANIQ